ncbi:ferredoxin [Mycolicibacterium sp. XJ879]
MTRIEIDGDLCMGSKECAGIAAHAVTFDENGIASPTGADLDEVTAAQLESSCPAMAISVITD